MRPAALDDGEWMDSDDGGERTAGDECVDDGERTASGSDGERTTDGDEASTVYMCVSDGWMNDRVVDE